MLIYTAYFRYTLDINLTDEQVNHPLMREAEGVVSGQYNITFLSISSHTNAHSIDHVGLTNDFFSYVKEKLTNSDDTNIIRILQDHEGLTYEQAKIVIEKKIRQKEQDFIPAGMAVLNDPELGSDPEVRRWIANLPYCMGGNNAWSQEVCILLLMTLAVAETQPYLIEWPLQCWRCSRWPPLPFIELRS